VRVNERLDGRRTGAKENRMLKNCHLPANFLIGWDISDFDRAAQQKISREGRVRGLANPSAVCYSSELRRSLRSAWKRSLNGFLSEEKNAVSEPDIDLDLPPKRRPKREGDSIRLIRATASSSGRDDGERHHYRDRSGTGRRGQKALGFDQATLDSFRASGEQRRMARSVGLIRKIIFSRWAST